MNAEVLANAAYAQGDVMRAVQTIVQHELPLDTPGADECERLLREYGEGNTPMWPHGRYLAQTVHLAQEIVRTVRGLPA